MPLSRSHLDPDRSSAQEQNRAPLSIRRCNVLGVGVSAINPSVALETIGKWIDYRECHYVCITGVHGVMESQRDPQLKHIHNRAGLVTPDGMPLVWISRLRGFRGVDRVYGPDLMLAISGLSASGGSGISFTAAAKVWQNGCPRGSGGNSPACKSSAPIARPSGRSLRKKTRGS